MFAIFSYVFKRAKQSQELHENSCCRCLRRAWEVAPNECDAIFAEDGAMVVKCGNCARSRKDCVSVSFHTRLACCWLALPSLTRISKVPRKNSIRVLANALMARRILCERFERRGWTPDNPQYRDRQSLQDGAQIFDMRLTAVQRVLSRFGLPKLPNSLTIEIEKAKTLRGIAASLEGIWSVCPFHASVSRAFCPC